MFPGMGGISFLTRRTSRSIADEMIRSGRQYTALELLELGVVDQVVDTGEAVNAMRKLMSKRQNHEAGHAAMNTCRPHHSPAWHSGVVRHRKDLGRLCAQVVTKKPRVDATAVSAPTRDLRAAARSCKRFGCGRTSQNGRARRVTERRVAITGLGVVSPHGCDVGEMFDALMRGVSAVRKIAFASGADEFGEVAAAVPGDPWLALPRAQRIMTDRVSQYALLAADAAVSDAALNFESEDLDRVGVSVGTCMGGILTTEAAYEDLFRKRMTRVSPFTLVKTMYNAPAAHIGIKYGLRGPSLTYTTTCSSSAISIGEAMRQIRHGYADVMIAGGAEALLAYGSVKAWQALQILAPGRPDNPSATCRPFSRDRNGTVIGEGAAFVVSGRVQSRQLRAACASMRSSRAMASLMIHRT